MVRKANGNLALVKLDEDRMKEIPEHTEFWATVFYSLSSFAFTENVKLGHVEKLPSFSDPFWTGNTPAGLVWASNISITSKGFHNESHVDNDLSVYAFGVFCYCLSDTGEIYLRSQNPEMGDVKGASFWLDKYHIKIDFDHCDGVIEMLWRSDTHHHSSCSTTRDANGSPIDPKKAAFTRFGSSCQINRNFVNQVRFMVAAKETMTPTEWDTFLHDSFKDYEQESNLRSSWTPKATKD